MSFRHFVHEIRTAARDTFPVAAIPVALILLCFALWQGLWLESGFWNRLVATGSGSQIYKFPDVGWVYVGWLIPWWLLRNPALRDEHALWRTGPVGKWTLFGARLSWCFFATVALPVAAAGVFCAFAEPVLAVGQMVNVLWIQFTMFCLGVFAAFIAKRDRGVWIVAGLAGVWYVTNLAGDEASRWVLRRWVLSIPATVTRPTSEEYSYVGMADTWSRALSWPAIVAWILIPALVTLWTPWSVATSVRRSRWWVWIPIVFLVAALSQASLFLSPYRRPKYPDTTLPLVRVEMKPAYFPDDGGHPGPTQMLGLCDVTLPEPDLYIGNKPSGGGWGEYWGSGSMGWGSEARLSGEWTCGKLSGAFSPQLYATRTGLNAIWRRGDTGMLPARMNMQNGLDFQDVPEVFRPLKETFGRPGIRVWTAMGGGSWNGSSADRKAKIRFEWVDSDSFAVAPKLRLGFGIPNYWNGVDQSGTYDLPGDTFNGKTVSIRAKARVWRLLPPKIIGRVPVSRGGEMRTPQGWLLKIAAMEPGDASFHLDYHRRSGPVELRPKMPDNFADESGERFRLMVYNAKAAQALILPENYGGMYSLPAHMPELSSEWWKESEFVVLEYKDEPVTLPLELSLKVPARK